MKLSVIIPALNEREHLPATFVALEEAGLAHEVITVDGGSTDGTQDWVRNHSTAYLIEAERGRGLQMNAGAQVASGDTLLFLHADCTVSPGAFKTIARVFGDDKVVGGCFRIGFAEQWPHPSALSLSLVACAINSRSSALKTATGDQAIFVRRSTYDAVGGFAFWPLFEDVDFVTRIKRLGEFVVSSPPVVISARRWLTCGVWRTTFLMGLLLAGYRVGIPPVRLKRWFSDMRPACREAKRA